MSFSATICYLHGCGWGADNWIVAIPLSGVDLFRFLVPVEGRLIFPIPKRYFWDTRFSDVCVLSARVLSVCAFSVCFFMFLCFCVE